MSNITHNQVVELAIETGALMLKSGSETHKVETVMERVCTGFGYAESEAFVNLTGIFLSVKDSGGNVITSLKRIASRSTDLEKMTQISRLTKELIQRNNSEVVDLQRPPMSYDEYHNRLESIRGMKQYPALMRFLCGGLSCACFCMLFGGSWRQFLTAIPVGIIVRMVLTWLGRTRLNQFLLNAVGAGLVVWLSKMLVLHIGLMSSDKIIIGGIMLLVPGLSITNAIRDSMAGDVVAGTARSVEALFISVGIAAGAGTMLKLWSLLVS